jgi:hypothetical protein
VGPQMSENSSDWETDLIRPIHRSFQWSKWDAEMRFRVKFADLKCILTWNTYQASSVFPFWEVDNVFIAEFCLLYCWWDFRSQTNHTWNLNTWHNK